MLVTKLPLMQKLTWFFFLMFVHWKLNQNIKRLPSLCSHLFIEMELKVTAGYFDDGLLKEFSLHKEKRKKQKLSFEMR